MSRGFSRGCPLPGSIPEAVGRWSRVDVSRVRRALCLGGPARGASARWGGEDVHEGEGPPAGQRSERAKATGNLGIFLHGKGVRMAPVVLG